jgi:hypothetical protein
MAVHGKYKELVSGNDVETEVKDEEGEDLEPAEGDLLIVQRVLNAQVDVCEE